MAQRTRKAGMSVGYETISPTRTPPKRPAEKFVSHFISTSFGVVSQPLSGKESGTDKDHLSK
jgi:hypothetical protein